MITTLSSNSGTTPNPRPIPSMNARSKALSAYAGTLQTDSMQSEVLFSNRPPVRAVDAARASCPSSKSGWRHSCTKSSRHGQAGDIATLSRSDTKTPFDRSKSQVRSSLLVSDRSAHLERKQSLQLQRLVACVTDRGLSAYRFLRQERNPTSILLPQPCL